MTGAVPLPMEWNLAVRLRLCPCLSKQPQVRLSGGRSPLCGRSILPESDCCGYSSCGSSCDPFDFHGHTSHNRHLFFQPSPCHACAHLSAVKDQHTSATVGSLYCMPDLVRVQTVGVFITPPIVVAARDSGVRINEVAMMSPGLECGLRRRGCRSCQRPSAMLRLSRKSNARGINAC